MELKEKSKLQKEMEILDKNYTELEQTRKHEIAICKTDFDRANKENIAMNEEKRTLRDKMSQITIEHEKLKGQHQQKCDRYDLLERDHKQHQEHQRDIVN